MSDHVIPLLCSEQNKRMYFREFKSNDRAKIKYAFVSLQIRNFNIKKTSRLRLVNI